MATGPMVMLDVAAQVRFDDYMLYPLNAKTEVVTVGDVDGDGLLEVIVGVGDTPGAGIDHSILVMDVDTLGVLSTPVVYPYDTVPNFSPVKAIGAGDLNADGLVDVAIGFGDSIGVLFQNAGHTLDPVMTWYSGSQVDGLAVGDVNDDGIADLAVSHGYWNQVRVFHGSSNPFTTASYPHPSAGNNQIAIADMNADGLNDVLLKPSFFTHTIQAFHQDGNGGLNAVVPVSLSFGQSMNGMAVGDLDGDGLNDLAITTGGNQPSCFLRSLYQDPVDHDLFNSSTLAVSDLPRELVVRDLDCDGSNEVVVLHGSSAMRWYTRDGLGQLMHVGSAVLPYDPSRAQTSLAMADLDLDGRSDLLVTGDVAGLATVRNRSLPHDPDSVLVMVTVDTVNTDSTLIYLNDVTLVEMHTIDSIIVTTHTYYSLYDVHRNDHIQVDTVTTYYGMMCGKYVMDSVVATTSWTSTTDLGVDSVLMYSWSDTSSVGMGEVVGPSISYHPNPAHDQLVVEFDRSFGAASFEYGVLDMEGRICLSGRIPGPRGIIALTGVPEGSYIMRIRAGSSTHVFRFVVVK